tara:strand:- start:1950 stop:2372 length:423 start_codon:yes stop_codon:yes gene_type:complete
MENKYQIVISYIQDLSIEIPSADALITIRNTIPEYKMKVDIKSKPLKRKMIEVLTTLTYENPIKKKDKGFFQIKYATVIEIKDLQIKKTDLEKIVLCDLQTEIYPELEEKFLTILRNSGLPDLKFGAKIDFKKLYEKRVS